MWRNYNVHSPNAMARQTTNKPFNTWRHFRFEVGTLWHLFLSTRGREVGANWVWFETNDGALRHLRGSWDELKTIGDRLRLVKAVERHLRWVGVNLRHIEGVERHSSFKWAEVNSGPNQLDALTWNMLWHLRYTGTSCKTSGLTLRRIALNLDQFEWRWNEWVATEKSNKGDNSKM